jgi:hypothetical protein
LARERVTHWRDLLPASVLANCPACGGSGAEYGCYMNHRGAIVTDAEDCRYCSDGSVYTRDPADVAAYGLYEAEEQPDGK